jgi:hypothetical protein
VLPVFFLKEIKMDKYIPKVGDYIKPDGWKIGEKLLTDDGYKDSSFPGCQFRLPAHDYRLAVNIKVTGKAYWTRTYSGPSFKSRVRIEFVGDGEPSSFCGGYIYHD